MGSKRGRNRGRPRLDMDEAHLHRGYYRLDLSDRVALRRLVRQVAANSERFEGVYVRWLIQRHIDELRGVPPEKRRGRGLLYPGHPALRDAKV